MYDIENIKNDLRENLSEYRYNHSLNVAEECVKLADKYGVDKEKAYLTGLVHDIAKEFSDEENFYYINKYGLNDDYINFSRIIHSYVGAFYLKEKYDMEEDVVKAVMVHTVPGLEMSLLDKILFVADKIEKGKDYTGIEEEREIAYIDLDKALLLCLENNYKKLESKGKRMHPNGIKVLKLLKKKFDLQ